MRRRPLLALPLLALPGLAVRPAHEQGCGAPEKLYGHHQPTDAQVALVAIAGAAQEHRVSANLLYLLAETRSKLTPALRTAGTPRYYGLFAFTQTQWRETQLGLGRTWQQIMAADIMDPDLQADAAAWLVSNGRPLRGDPNG